jgi:diguanylate cyclase (GGDEF)-like protein
VYAPAVARVALVASASVLVLVLPRTGPVHWWAVPLAASLLGLAGALAWWRDVRVCDTCRWPGLLAVLHVLIAQTGSGFAGVAVGGIEGNQRFLLLALLVVTASSSGTGIAAFAWLTATVTVFWSAVVGGTPADVALTVTAMFALSGAAITAIVHSVLANQRAQARLASATAALAASIARGDTLDDLADVLPLASDVLGGPPLQLLHLSAGQEPLEVGAFQRPPDEPVRSRWSALTHPRDVGVDEQVLISTSPGEAYVLVVRWPSGTARRAVPPRTVLVVRDLLCHLVERARRISDLRVTTMTDPLTGLGNRRALGEWMRRRSPEATLVLFDLDHFKRFNDTHGHLEGDALLRRFGATVRAHLRDDDCAARIGGEEFCVALDRSDVHVAHQFVERVRAAFASDRGRVTFSAGLAEVDGPETTEQVLARADEALYEAKRNGRDRTVVAPPGRRPGPGPAAEERRARG